MATTHDYRVRTWGRNVCLAPSGMAGCASASGWGRGIKGGDHLLLPEARYRVEDITYYLDPPDMWSATLRVVPREEGGAGEHAQ